MRRAGMLFVLLATAGCQPQEVPNEDAALIAAIEYPACDDVWDGQKLSACGGEVFKKSTEWCRGIIEPKLEPGAAIVDEYMPDSWQKRAGEHTTRNDDQRIADLRRDKTGAYVSTYAYALANGTKDIKAFNCEINDQMRLTKIS